jgi:hypothetical protein
MTSMTERIVAASLLPTCLLLQLPPLMPPPMPPPMPLQLLQLLLLRCCCCCFVGDCCPVVPASCWSARHVVLLTAEPFKCWTGAQLARTHSGISTKTSYGSFPCTRAGGCSAHYGRVRART